jgi:hypothetical protein
MFGIGVSAAFTVIVRYSVHFANVHDVSLVHFACCLSTIAADCVASLLVSHAFVAQLTKCECSNEMFILLRCFFMAILMLWGW